MNSRDELYFGHLAEWEQCRTEIRRLSHSLKTSTRLYLRGKAGEAFPQENLRAQERIVELDRRCEWLKLMAAKFRP